MKNKLFNIANMPKYGYINRALSKISKLALVGYYYKGAYSPLRAFFMRSNSMRSHFMVKLEGDIFGCAGFLCSQSTNPFQLCHLNYLVVIGKAPIYKGAHSHA
ncbi:hypothetical protein [Acinetobacter schindleri]|uniref:hypothetical protein n=1 Tax=Acinetobacter schindleri TaxID=108981 RepID=UPI000976EB74|nr:hypothetical protein [Acinetobacter schindleri]